MRACFDAHGLSEHRLNACGYSLGAIFAPTWMDWPMFYAGNPVVRGRAWCSSCT